jgi:hypothetical protein
VLVDQLRAMDNMRLVGGPLATLGPEEMTCLQDYVLEVRGVVGSPGGTRQGLTRHVRSGPAVPGRSRRSRRPARHPRLRWRTSVFRTGSFRLFW